MNLETLVGKKFKYDSPTTGVSEWTDTVKSVGAITNIGVDLVEKKLTGYKLEMHVTGEENGYVYELENVIFITE